MIRNKREKGREIMMEKKKKERMRKWRCKKGRKRKKMRKWRGKEKNEKMKKERKSGYDAVGGKEEENENVKRKGKRKWEKEMAKWEWNRKTRKCIISVILGWCKK